MPTTEQRETAMAEKLLKNSEKILSLIDESFIVRERGHAIRQMPRFRPEEVSLGKTLGVGGFGVVSEISRICLDLSDRGKDLPPPSELLIPTPEEEREQLKKRQQQQEKGGSDAENNKRTENGAQKGEGGGGQEQHHHHDDSDSSSNDSDHHDDKRKESNDGGGGGEKNGEGGAAATNSGKVRSVSLVSAATTSTTNNSSMAVDDAQVHYEISKARHVMAKRAVRNGVCRYAIKRLHASDLSELERARGMVDLAVEAKYLSVVWHPNIIKMRGMACGPLVDPYFFIILDRLFMTLDQKINEWYHQNKKFQGRMFGIGKKKHALKDLMLDRMTVAYDLAAAFFYLHENRLVYRDIKPENIGFDIRGDVKVFDFGLCKSLSPSLKAKNGGYGYRLTGRAGSLPYMAPEVIKMETYDTKCDVYSFSILLWEILCLQQSFKGLSPSQFVEEVVVKHTRLPIPNTIPPLTRLMMPEAWDADPRKRPDMKRVAILIRGDLNDMTDDAAILHRTKHMVNRSRHSSHDKGFDLGGGPPTTAIEHLEQSDDEN